MQILQFDTEAAPHGLLGNLRHMLEAAFEGDFADTDWDHTIGGRHVVVVDGDQVLSHASVISRTIEVDGVAFRTGYVEAVATHPSEQGKGHGSSVMREIERTITAGFDIGALATGEHSFYERLGWNRWLGPTSVRRSTGLERTPEDDDAVMVLLWGDRVATDLTAHIVCDERRGDVW